MSQKIDSDCDSLSTDTEHSDTGEISFSSEASSRARCTVIPFRDARDLSFSSFMELEEYIRKESSDNEHIVNKFCLHHSIDKYL